MRKDLTLIFALLLLFTTLSAQENETFDAPRNRKSIWLDMGTGWGGQGIAGNIGLLYEVSRNRSLAFRYSGVVTEDRCTDYAFFIPVSNEPLGEDGQSYEITYGILAKRKAWVFNFGAGIAVTKIDSGHGDLPPSSPLIFVGSTCPADYTLTHESTAGLALRIDAMPTLRWAGLGISTYANVNSKYSFASLTFELALGRIRPR